MKPSLPNPLRQKSWETEKQGMGTEGEGVCNFLV